MEAFNAALVIFSSLVVASKEREGNPSAWSVVDESRPYHDKAIEVLHRLDHGNRVVGRCIEYLSQLSLVLNTLSTSDQFNSNNNGLSNLLSGYTSDFLDAQSTNPLPAMDLGEFMIDQDLDFLGKVFNTAVK